jgi:release factor glutamine methyltransferase
LSHSTVLGRLRAAGCVYAEDEAALLIAAAPTSAELDAMVSARVGGTPLEYLLGWAEFCGLRVVVEPSVFVPRRRTEFLVQQAEALLRTVATQSQPVVLDLCCGTGAIGLALRASVAHLELHATDCDPVAVHCARRNLGGDCQIYAGDLFDPLPHSLRRRVDILAANAPYVPTAAIATMPREAREHESRSALDGGLDGLSLARPVVAAAPQWLAPGGHVLIETSQPQAGPLALLMAEHGLVAKVVGSEDFDATVVIGTRR